MDLFTCNLKRQLMQFFSINVENNVPRSIEFPQAIIFLHHQAIKNIASVNECSSVIPFEDLLGHPDWLTDILFKVVEMKVAAEKTGSEEKVIQGKTFEHVLFDFDRSDIR